MVICERGQRIRMRMYQENISAKPITTTIAFSWSFVWAIVTFYASLWAGTRAFDRNDSRRIRLMSAASCIALALLFLWHLLKIVAG